MFVKNQHRNLHTCHVLPGSARTYSSGDQERSTAVIFVTFSVPDVYPGTLARFYINIMVFLFVVSVSIGRIGWHQLYGRIEITLCRSARSWSGRQRQRRTQHLIWNEHKQNKKTCQSKKKQETKKANFTKTKQPHHQHSTTTTSPPFRLTFGLLVHAIDVRFRIKQRW